MLTAQPRARPGARRSPPPLQRPWPQNEDVRVIQGQTEIMRNCKFFLKRYSTYLYLIQSLQPSNESSMKSVQVSAVGSSRISKSAFSRIKARLNATFCHLKGTSVLKNMLQNPMHWGCLVLFCLYIILLEIMYSLITFQNVGKSELNNKDKKNNWKEQIRATALHWALALSWINFLGCFAAYR